MDQWQRKRNFIQNHHLPTSACVYSLFSVYRITPPKFNIAPENLASQKERIVFQPSILNGRYVKLWGVYMLDMSFMVIMLLKVLRLFKKPIDQNQCLLNQKISNGCLGRQWETFASLGKNQSQRRSSWRSHAGVVVVLWCSKPKGRG